MAVAWLASLLDRVRAARVGRAMTQEQKLAGILHGRPGFGGEAGFLAALSQQIAAVQPIDARAVELVAAYLAGERGEELDRIGAHLGEHLAFWTDLADKSGSPLARACAADLLRRSGDPSGALAEFLDAVEGDPTLVHFRRELAELARERGGQVWLRYRLACLRAALFGFRPNDEDEAGDDDYVRELYCELIEENRADPDALARVRELGTFLDEAVERGELPRAIVRRAPRE